MCFLPLLFSVESESDTEKNMQGLSEGRRISSGLTEVIQFKFDKYCLIYKIAHNYW